MLRSCLKQVACVLTYVTCQYACMHPTAATPPPLPAAVKYLAKRHRSHCFITINHLFSSLYAFANNNHLHNGLHNSLLVPANGIHLYSSHPQALPTQVCCCPHLWSLYPASSTNNGWVQQLAQVARLHHQHHQHWSCSSSCSSSRSSGSMNAQHRAAA
jgi:hypothetical protein